MTGAPMTRTWGSQRSGGVNAHLGILHSTGLVIPQRDGREVTYLRTGTGDDFVAAAGQLL